MFIDDYLELAKQQKQNPNMEMSASKDWAQGRTVFGGLSACILYAASKEYVEADRVLRSMNTSFVGPLLSQVPFRIEVEIVRAGKNVSQLQARAIQNDKVCVLSQLCFGGDRASKIIVENHEKHNMEVPKKGNFLPQIPKITPKFLRHFELAITQGGIPFTGKDKSAYSGWMRFKKPPANIVDAHIISLIDVMPAPLLQMLKWPAPVSTVSWNVEFIHPHRQLLPSDWFALKSHTRQAANGYGHIEATIWDMHGEVIALSRQTVAIFD